MLYCLGDIHGDYHHLMHVADAAKEAGAEAVIQLGDFGWYSNNVRFFITNTPAVPVYALDGNHEDHRMLPMDATGPVEMFPNLFFIPRGTIFTLDGRRIACLGGAASVDKAYRLRQNIHWSPDEDITAEQEQRLFTLEIPDIFLTHVPPQSVIQRHFDPMALRFFGLSPSWRDPNADIVERLWNKWNNPMIYSGHMHASKSGKNYRILDINETVEV
jgi:predicted phosphodiesterase